jgi:hypothetical protein
VPEFIIFRYKTHFSAIEEDFSTIEKRFSIVAEDFSTVEKYFSMIAEDFSMTEKCFSIVAEDFSMIEKYFSVIAEDFSVMAEDAATIAEDFSMTEKEHKVYPEADTKKGEFDFMLLCFSINSSKYTIRLTGHQPPTCEAAFLGCETEETAVKWLTSYDDHSIMASKISFLSSATSRSSLFDMITMPPFPLMYLIM